MPSLDWNVAQWANGGYDWSSGGEEWSWTWGGSEAQWFGALFPRLHPFLPANTLLEIAPGFGRWTKFLLPACDSYIGVDLSSTCAESCRQSFAAATHAQFLQNDGLSLDGVAAGSVDFVFSFDSLVHAEFDVFASYVPQILQKLTQTGVAFLHHSNLAALDASLGMPHARAVSVCARTIAELIAENEGKVLVQEMINWGSDVLLDSLTLFGKAQAYTDCPSITLTNPQFMEEAKLIAQYQSPYSRLKRALDTPSA